MEENFTNANWRKRKCVSTRPSRNCKKPSLRVCSVRADFLKDSFATELKPGYRKESDVTFKEDLKIEESENGLDSWEHRTGPQPEVKEQAGRAIKEEVKSKNWETGLQLENGSKLDCKERTCTTIKEEADDQSLLNDVKTGMDINCDVAECRGATVRKAGSETSGGRLQTAAGSSWPSAVSPGRQRGQPDLALASRPHTRGTATSSYSTTHKGRTSRAGRNSGIGPVDSSGAKLETFSSSVRQNLNYELSHPPGDIAHGSALPRPVPDFAEQESACEIPPVFRCSLCSSEFSTESAAAAHTIRDHLKTKRYHYLCIQCNQVFLFRHELRHHNTAVHEQQDMLQRDTARNPS